MRKLHVKGRQIGRQITAPAAARHTRRCMRGCWQRFAVCLKYKAKKSQCESDVLCTAFDRRLVALHNAVLTLVVLARLQSRRLAICQVPAAGPSRNKPT